MKRMNLAVVICFSILMFGCENVPNVLPCEKDFGAQEGVNGDFTQAPVISFSLAPNSPSGAVVPLAEQVLLVFHVSANADMALGSLRTRIYTTNEPSTLSNIQLYINGWLVATDMGSKWVNGNESEFSGIGMVFPKNSVTEVRLTADTASLDPKANDLVQMSVVDFSTVPGGTALSAQGLVGYPLTF